MSLFKKSLIWIEGDVAQLVERRTSNTGPMVRNPVGGNPSPRFTEVHREKECLFSLYYFFSEIIYRLTP